MDKLTVHDDIVVHDKFPQLRRHQFRIPNFHITISFLNAHPNVFFVFGDNLLHRGKGGAAALRDHPNAIGFITKKYPNNDLNSFFQPGEYSEIFKSECSRMYDMMANFPNHYYLFSKLGGGLANKFCIFERLIEPWLLNLENKFINCSILF